MSKKMKNKLMLRHACLKQNKKTTNITSIKMVITGIENWSPDMISVAFERKFDEKKDEIPPGIYRHHIFIFFQYWEVGR